MSVDAVKKYADVFERLSAVTALCPENTASAYLLGGEDQDGLNVTARLVAAKLGGIPLSQAFDDNADIIVYPQASAPKKTGKSKKADSEKTRRVITVDDVREIVGALYLTPFRLAKRFFIIENADTMSEICQNKLLKSLEEPPPCACFILCACGKLLQTVESRCNRIDIPPFSVDTVTELLSRHHRDAKAVALAARASRGNIGMAEQIMADPEFGATYSAALEILRLSAGSKMFAHCAAVYEKFSKERDDAVLGVMEYLLADVARMLAGAETVFDVSDIGSVANGFTPLSAACSAEFVRTARRRLASNCMPTAVMDEMILKMMEEKAICLR